MGSRSLMGGVQDWSSEWASKARNAAETADGFVRSNPWQAAGAVAAAGVAAGILLSSARAKLGRARRRATDGANRDSPSEVSGG
jgi:hypothetical protein